MRVALGTRAFCACASAAAENASASAPTTISSRGRTLFMALLLLRLAAARHRQLGLWVGGRKRRRRAGLIREIRGHRHDIGPAQARRDAGHAIGLGRMAQTGFPCAELARDVI